MVTKPLELRGFGISSRRHAATTCAAAWDVSGEWNFGFVLDGDLTSYVYVHHASLAKSGVSVTGTGGYPVTGGDTYSWNITSGSVAGNTISLAMNYTLGALDTTMHMTGAIAANGTMSGTWDDNYLGGARTGTWSSTAGAAQKVFSGCTAKGSFSYLDVSGTWYVVDVRYAQVSGDAWFAGPVVAGNVGAGNWLFAKVHDGAEPAVGLDQIWGSFTTGAAALNGVESMGTPGDGPFPITSGNLQVH